jgi:hypothetical protein
MLYFITQKAPIQNLTINKNLLLAPLIYVLLGYHVKLPAFEYPLYLNVKFTCEFHRADGVFYYESCNFGGRSWDKTF